MTLPKKITVLIPNFNGMKWLGECLKSLNSQDTSDFHTIVVDNGSTDGSVRFIEQHFPSVEIVELANNTGFANAANVGIGRSVSPYVVLLNSDTQVVSNWLSSLLEEIEKSPKDIAAINSQLLRMDDSERIDDAGDELSWYGVALKRGHNRLAAEYQESSEIFSPCAAACLYRRDFLLAVGGFDARFFAYLEDVDLGFRGRLLGYRYLYLPKAKVLHKGHGAEMPHSSYVAMVTRNRLLLFAKNVPARLLLRHAVRILYGQIYFLLAYARPWASIKGYLSFMAELPRAMTDRRRILKTTRMKPEDIDLLLHRRPPHTGLATLVGGYLSRLAGPATQ